MRAYKRWNAAGTMAYVRVVGEPPEDAETSVLYHEIPDGASTILDPVALIVRYADGSETWVTIESIATAEGVS